MSQTVVVPVKSKKHQNQFMQLIWDLYRNDPNWVPPLRQNQKELVGFAKHPFHAQNELQAFVALRDDQPVGRVVAILNHGHNKRFEEKRGFFGFFESIDDESVAKALFEAVRAWFAEKDISDIRGPCNPSLNHEIGLLVEGFDTPPCFMMTYNPPYYGKLIESCGFSKVEDLFAFWGHIDMLGKLESKLKFIGEETTRRFNIKVRPFDRKRFRQDVDAFLNIYNQALVGTWGFVPLSEAEAAHMAKSLKHLIVPELAIFAEVDEEPIGVVFGLLDYNPRIKKIDGRLFPFGFLRLLSNRRAIKTVRLISTNVIPAYQKWGVGLVLLQGLIPAVLDWGITEAEFSWVLESNHLSRATLERGGAKKTKTYRIYDG